MSILQGRAIKKIRHYKKRPGGIFALPKKGLPNKIGEKYVNWLPAILASLDSVFYVRDAVFTEIESVELATFSVLELGQTVSTHPYCLFLDIVYNLKKKGGFYENKIICRFHSHPYSLSSAHFRGIRF
jgi:hypothetical protein